MCPFFIFENNVNALRCLLKIASDFIGVSLLSSRMNQDISLLCGSHLEQLLEIFGFCGI